MALADPQVVTYNSHAGNLARTGMTANSSSYKTTTVDGDFTLTLTQNPTGTKNRRSIRLDFSRIVSDPLIPANSRVTSNSVTLVMETPSVGSTPLTDWNIAVSFLNMIRASSDVMVLKCLAGEV